MTDYLITSALPYINGVKHLGNLVGSLLPADVHARFRRQNGDNVLFICGSDEHGTPAELAASAAGQDVRTFCDEQHAVHADIYRRFGLSFDYFGRTSSSHNIALTQHLYRRLDEAGLIEERDVQQVWSPTDGRFLPDRYVLGRCPHCGYADARGDQCDGCGRLLDPVDLVDPRSAISGARDLERRDSRHLFLLQSKLVEQLNDWIDTRKGWPPFVVSLAKGLVTHDLQDRCITRDLSWGVPVPRPGFEGKVFYVWIDAPIGYISATQAWADEAPETRNWTDWWHADRDVRLIQCLAKDNLYFHAVSFPATIIGSGEPLRTVDIIKGFHWLQYEGGKFSTSRGRGVFLDQALERFPADYWRWYLTANAPETADVDFTFARFADVVNKDLADVFGNLVNRTTSFAERHFDGRIPTGDGKRSEAEAALVEDLKQRLESLRRCHEELEFRRTAAETRAIWDVANAWFQKAQPWTTVKTNPNQAARDTRIALNLVRLCATIAWSVIPALSETVLQRFGDQSAIPAWPKGDIGALLDADGGLAIAQGTPLVAKIEDARVAELEVIFRGGA